nr:RNA-directed DNA polymerase, eukaryota [Tanacetum cinerariifolium]
ANSEASPQPEVYGLLSSCLLQLTLFKSVLGSMPIYHMSLFKVPKKVLHRMESMRSHFFNGAELSSKKSVWVKWKHALASKDKSGLGVSRLFAINRALMFKWVWHFITQGSSLWARVIKALHGYDGKIGQKVKSCYPSLWLDIIHEVEIFKSRGLDVSFRRPPKGGVEIQQFEHMKEKVEGCILADMMDRWFWALEGSGEFTITSVRKMIDDFVLPEVSSKTCWIKAVPIKVNVHAWKVKLNGLPTRLNISRRGIDIESILYLMCGKAVESTSHIFFTCQISKEILRMISRWWDIDYMEISYYEEWLDWILNIRLSVKSKKLFEGVCYVLWWHVWSFRNKTIFGSQIPSKAMIFDDVKQQARLVYPDQKSIHKEVEKIASAFNITNFPDCVDAKRLWVECQSYGRIVDAFIANKRSKSGKRDSKVKKQVTAVKGNTLSNVPLTPSLITLALVLDDSCVSVRDMSRHVMGRVKDLNSIPNLRTLLTKEGFPNVKLTYLGGMWVMIELDNEATKLKFLQHNGVNSWFHVLQAAIYDFVNNERVVWVDIEGADNTLEKFKVIFKGKVYMACTKELFTWTPIFLDHKESEYISDDESLHEDSDSSLSHPPGFTPEVSRQENNHRGVDLNTEINKVNSPLVHMKVMNNSQKVHENVTSNREFAFNYSHNAHNGGLILEVLDDLIRISNNSKVLIMVIYAPQSLSHKRVLWDNILSFIACWNGETIVMGDFNKVRLIDERFGLMFNQSSSRLFNYFITSSRLVDAKLEGYTFTWAHPSATKMSKLDHFLVTKGIISLFLSITALCLDRHLSDHRPIILREIHTDYGPIPFCFYHYWFKWDRFDVMVEQAWNYFSHSDTNGLIRFKKKLQDLKKIIRSWIRDKKLQQSGAINSIKKDLIDIDKNLDSGNVSDEILLKRMELTRVFVDGDWNTDPEVVKDVFKDHFATRFKQPAHGWLKLNISFPNRLSTDQVADIDRSVSRDEFRVVV